MVRKRIETLMDDSGEVVRIEFVVIHNDAGSMTPDEYVDWLSQREKALGIAHYYCDRECIARVIDTGMIGYHTGDWWSNCRSIGYEVCESLSTSDEEFLQNEDVTLAQATEDLLAYGLPITTETVRLHHEFVPTTCPHRSLALHGGTTESVKEYFVDRMQFFASLGSTVDEILEAIGQQDSAERAFVETSSSEAGTMQAETVPDENGSVMDADTLEQLAKEVIEGDWGNGEERRERLESSGYDYESVQERVNEMMGEL